VSPRVGLDVCEKSRLHRDSIPGPSSPQPVAIPTKLARLARRVLHINFILQRVKEIKCVCVRAHLNSVGLG
jgi:hypothetical protein